MPVELAFEPQRGSGFPGRPDGPQSPHELAHPRDWAGPGHTEAPLDMGSDLRPESEDKPSGGQSVQVMRGMRDRHRAAGEGHRDARAEAYAGRPASRDHE